MSGISAGWNLGNTLDAHGEWIVKHKKGVPEDFETAWGNPITTEALMKGIQKAGFSAVRVPVTWAQHIDRQHPYQIDPSWMDRVRSIVDLVLDNNMYCILNLHHDTGNNEESWLNASEECMKMEKERFISVWRQIAHSFADYDGRLLFEGFNEILNEKNEWAYPGKGAGRLINQFNQIFVDTVRNSGGNNRFRCLIVNTYAAAIDERVFQDFRIPDDSTKNALFVGCHYYYPNVYCMEITGERNDQSVWKEEDGVYIMETRLSLLYDYFTKKGQPVLLSEFAAANKDNEVDRADWAGTLVKKAKDYGIKCFWWDPGGDMRKNEEFGYYPGKALYDRYRNNWAFPMIMKALTE